MSYSKASLDASQSVKGVLIDEAIATLFSEKFIKAFGAMGTNDFENKITDLFSDDVVYVNDTLAEHYSKSKLAKYFLPMSDRANNMNIEILNYYYKEDVLYLHWTMAFDLKILGKNINMFSSGVTHLKINENAQILYQQDYWDPNNGLYRKLPYIGWLYRMLLPVK